MTIGSSIVLIAIGAILKWAVTAHVSGIDLQTAGTVLFVVAAWRMPAGDRTRVSLDYGPGRPSIPTTTRTTAP